MKEMNPWRVFYNFYKSILLLILFLFGVGSLVSFIDGVVTFTFWIFLYLLATFILSFFQTTLSRILIALPPYAALVWIFSAAAVAFETPYGSLNIFPLVILLCIALLLCAGATFLVTKGWDRIWK